MIPTLQFDVSTLSIIYDTQLLSTAKGSRTLGMALEFGLSGDDSKLRALLRLEKDEWVQTRAANIASCVWHEKRHFLDFILTNYGAFRFRQFLEIYVNANFVIGQSRDSGALAVPLDANLCPITRTQLGVSEPCSETLKLSQFILSRKKLQQDDRKLYRTDAGQIEVGGDAQLEFLAYFVQMFKAQMEFGDELYRNVAEDIPGANLKHRRYSWMLEYLARWGLLDLYSMSDKRVLIDGSSVIPFCYGALAGRFYGQDQSMSSEVSSHLPRERFATLLRKLKEHSPNYAHLPTSDAWTAINEVCSKLFGRDVLEEIEVDYEEEEKLLHKIRERDVDDTVVKCLSDFHMLRGRMIKMLKDSPESVLNAREFSTKSIAMLRPNVVVAAPAGIIGAPPANIGWLCGYRHPTERESERVPEAEWWWTGLVKQNVPPEEMALGDFSAWKLLAAHFAPLAKLFLDGMAFRTMIGPELFSVLQRVKHEAGVQLVVDSTFSRPRERYCAKDWQYATGRETFRCEISDEVCSVDEGELLDTWDIRHRKEFMRSLISSAPDHLQERQAMTLWRDWSPWMIKREYADKIRCIAPDKDPYS